MMDNGPLHSTGDAADRSTDTLFHAVIELMKVSFPFAAFGLRFHDLVSKRFDLKP